MKNWRKYNYNLHRDLGFFFCGLILIYAISGILLNHRKEFGSGNEKQYTKLELKPEFIAPTNSIEAKACLEMLGLDKNSYLKFRNNHNKTMIVLNNGGFVVINELNGKAHLSTKKRSLIYYIDAFHTNSLKYWKLIADVLAIGLILLCITGVLVIKKLKSRQIWMIIVGVSIPILFAILNF